MEHFLNQTVLPKLTETNLSATPSDPSPPPLENDPSPPPPSDPSTPPPSDPSPPPPDSSAPVSSPSPPPPSKPPEASPPPPPSSDDNPSTAPPPPETAAPPPPDPTPVTNSSSTPVSPPPPASAAPAVNSSAPSPPAAVSGTPVAARSSLSPPRPPPPPASSSSSNSGIIIGGLLCGVLIIVMIVVLVTCCIKKKKRKQYYTDPPPRQGEYYNNWNIPPPKDHVVKLQPQPSWGSPPLGHFSSEFMGPNQPITSPSPMNIGPNQSSFSYDQLAAATLGFSQENLLGQGGFGYVHKGVLPNGREVAVKSLKSGSGQGEREFQAEVEMLSRVHHRHLVSLVGYCIADGQRMLVYEFVPNKTLEFHLHGKGQPVMDWATRMRIALGSAKGLAYLHEDCHPRIIHRDIKAANILLDNNFEAMVADFGLAKLSSDNNTHVSTRLMGTFGYLAPEYASSGKLTDKSDVFSFGVMLLELITGQKPVDHTSNYMEDSLVDWARPLMGQALENGNYNGLVDRLLENHYDPDEIARMVACASASIRHSARRRPRMIQIVRALEGDSSLDDLIDGPKPVQHSISSSNGSSIDNGLYDTGTYNTDMMKFKKMVMANETSEYGTTSEYGLNLSASSSDLTDSSSVQRHKI